MIKPFFRTEERQKALEAEALRWKDTPYFANQESCGYGVGCVNLIHALWSAPSVGAIPRLDVPQYACDYAHNSTQTQLLRFLLDNEHLKGRLLFVPVTGKRVVGDLYGVISGHVDHHLACALSCGRVVHAVEKFGVIFSRESDGKFAERVLYVLRLMEEVE